MRKGIKFRGQNSFSFNWIVGSLLIKDETPDTIMTYAGNKYEVLPETVGQFIGITDSMDKEIFTGDIVIDLKSRKYTVEFNDEFCAFFLYPIDDRESFMGIYPDIVLSIFGNIHENPELLK